MEAKGRKGTDVGEATEEQLTTQQDQCRESEAYATEEGQNGRMGSSPQNNHSLKRF